MVKCFNILVIFAFVIFDKKGMTEPPENPNFYLHEKKIDAS
jgi:hypothetical protein